MKVVYKYESVDGKVFDDEQLCINYEKLLEQEKQISSILLPRPKYGEVTVQGKDRVSEYRNRVADLCEENGFGGKHCDYFRRFNSFLLRILSDTSGHTANKLYTLAVRCMSIDENGDEWEQPYYAKKGSYE